MELISSLLNSHTGMAAGWMVIHMLWQATCIALVTGVLLLLLRHQPARVRYAVANVAMLLVLVAAAVTFYHYWQQVEPASAQTMLQMVYHQVNIPAASPMSPAASMPSSVAPATFFSGMTDYFQQHLPVIVTCWFLGMSLFLLKLLGNIGYVYYLKNHLNFPADTYWDELKETMLAKAGISRAVDLVESAIVRTPMVVGYLKPMILFPIGMINRLDPSEVEAIVAHELAHIRRHDYLFNVLQSIVETLFYFHPAIWWLSGRIRHEREIAADDAAVALTGNAVQYARALVMVQEMAFAPVTASLAFAGNRKNQLLRRIQHILNIQQSKSLAMEKFIGTSAIILLLMAVGYAQNKNVFGKSEASLYATATSAGYSGVWEGKIENDRVCLTLSSRSEHHQWVQGDCYPKTDFSALPVQESEFTMTRPAGVVTFFGKFDGNAGYGRFQFAPDQAFSAWLTGQGITGVNEDVLVALFFAGTDKNYITALKSAGYQQISGENLQNLAIHGLDQPTIAGYNSLAGQLGEQQPGIDEMVSYKIHDIDPAYANTLANAGFSGLKMEDILSAKIHGITPEKIAGYKKMGFSHLSTDDVMNLVIHQIDPAFMSEMQQLGFSGLSVDEAVNLKIHDIDAAYLSSLKNAGFSNMSMDDAVNCKIHNITADVVKDLEKAGFSGLSVDEVVNCKIHGVNSEFIQKMQKKGFKDLRLEEYVQLKVQYGERVESN